MKYFALTGLAGYIAPRHLKAIRETGNMLIAASDPHDSVGMIDSYFPDASFFTEYERLDRHLELIKRKGNGIDYLTVCSPNYLHDAHIRTALRAGADAICEKPLVLNPWNLDILQELEEENQKRSWTVLPRRLPPLILGLTKTMYQDASRKRKTVKLNY